MKRYNMENQSKFNELFDAFCEEKDIEQFFGDLLEGESDFLGLYELCEGSVTNEYDFDGQADLSAVYHFTDLNLYVKFYGYYRSYDGTHFIRYEFVEPVQVMVTKYEKV